MNQENKPEMETKEQILKKHTDPANYGEMTDAVYMAMEEYASQHSYTEQNDADFKDAFNRNTSTELLENGHFQSKCIYRYILYTATGIDEQESKINLYEMISESKKDTLTNSNPTYTQEQMIAFGNKIKGECAEMAAIGNSFTEIINTDISKFLL